jgi:hypothetical protein
LMNFHMLKHGSYTVNLQLYMNHVNELYFMLYPTLQINSSFEWEVKNCFSLGA